MKMLTLNQPQYLFDDEWLADSRRILRYWLPATVHPDPIIQSDRPWEGAAVVLYGSVLPAPGGGWRMYYSNFTPGAASGDAACRARPCMMLAESDNGLRWRKPDLDLVPDTDGRPTNIVFRPGYYIDSPSVFHEPADDAAPWKMITFATTGTHGEWADEGFGMHAYASADGLRWQPLRNDGKRVLCAGDRSSIVSEKIDGEYWLYTRHHEMGQQTGGRAVYLSRSRDFRKWTEPELVLRPDLDDTPDVEFYGMPVFRRHGWFFSLLEYWSSDTDCIEVHLAVSRDGRRWQRPWRKPFIAASYPWNRKWSSCSSNGPIILNEDMVFNFGGRMTSHHFTTSTLHGAIGRATLPLDRFCAVEGLSHGGQFTTPAFIWPGGELALNADTRVSYDSHPFHLGGEIGVEVLDAAGKEIADWSSSQRALFRGNTHCRCRIDAGIVRWPGNRSLAALAGRELRLRFHLRHARIHTFMASAPQ